MRVLVVEDNKKVASLIAKALKEEGYSVDQAHGGEDGSMMAQVHPYDLLLLDVMLPVKSGLEIVRSLRAGGSSVPILMLTARDAPDDIVMGLDAGADDYLTKPFGLDELLARVRALLRRGGAERNEQLRYADIEIDRMKHTATSGARRLVLTPKEFQLLEFFMLNPERVVRRTELLEKVWDLHFDPMSNVVDVHVAHLRKKLKGSGTAGQLLHTVRGVGYIFQRDAPG